MRAVLFRYGSLAALPLLPTVTASPRPRPVTQRHEQGRSYLALLVNYWMKRSELSHDQMARIADWGLGEAGWLSAPQLSHIRNRQLARGVSARNLEGLYGANRAIWLWQTQGQPAALRELGPHSSWRVDPESLDGAIWLPKAADDTAPLSYGDFAEINAGHQLQLPYLQDVALSPSEGADLSQRLYGLLNDLAGPGRPADGIARVLAAYPVADPERQRRIRDLMLGEWLTSEELEQELLALAQTISTLRGVPADHYTPADLHSELSSHRRRT